MIDKGAESVSEAAGNAETSKEHPWDETFRTLIYAVLLALVFRSFAFEPFHIPSSSMKDTLLIGDYVFVAKYSYGYSRYSFPFGLPLFHGRLMQRPPERGDIAVFRLPSSPRVDYIKRVVGLPGDRIQVKDGVLYINDVAVPKDPDGDFKEKVRVDGDIIYLNGESSAEKVSPDFAEKVGDNANLAIPRFKETLPNGVEYRVLDMTPQGAVDTTGVYTVPPKHYFMMGDNRDNSTDSRFTDQVGFIPEENLIGRADRIFFSMDDSASFWELWKWPSALRWERFFKPLD